MAEAFSSLPPSSVRLTFEMLALTCCGLFVKELIRKRGLTVEAQAGLIALLATSPAAILMVDHEGFIELANQSAVDLMAPRSGSLQGAPIAAFLPELHYALRRQEPTPTRSSMRCVGRRTCLGPFTADVWFSILRQGGTFKLSAILTKVTQSHPGNQKIPEIKLETDGRPIFTSL